MSIVASRSHMYSRMWLFCFIVIPTVLVGSWVLISKQAEGVRIAQFSAVITEVIEAADVIVDVKQRVVQYSDTESVLRGFKFELGNITQLTKLDPSIKSDNYQQIIKLLTARQNKLGFSVVTSEVASVREKEYLEKKLDLLQAIYSSLQISDGVNLTESEKNNLDIILDKIRNSKDHSEISKVLDQIRTQKMPQAIGVLWHGDKNDSLSSDLGEMIDLANKIANLESFEDFSAKIVLEDFQTLLTEHLRPELATAREQLIEQAQQLQANQRNTVLLTGLAMLLATASAIAFIMLPLVRRVAQSQAELSQSNTELQAAILVSKNAERAKSEFLANMSHEIRTPMNGVLGMAEILGKTEMDTRQRKFVDVIIKSGNALLTIINDILDFSKIDAGQLTLDLAPFQMIEAVEDVATLMSARVSEKDLELIVRVDPQLPEFYVGDVGRFRQVLTNLMGNAVKFTEKGHVLVNVSGYVKSGAAHLTVAVTDTGIGIPQDKLDTVFQQFSQVDASSTRRHEGTGLGLAIASSLVKLMHGHITVTSTVGHGTTFTATMVLPVHGGEQRVEKTLPADLTGARILIVDDNQVNRDILQEQMSAWGFDSAATNGAAMTHQFLDKASALGIVVDCFILDYHMPDTNGAMLATQLNADPRFKNVPRILLSSVDQIDHGNLIHQGILHAWLTKPATSKQLRETIVDTIHDARIKSAGHVTGLQQLAQLMRQPAHSGIEFNRSQVLSTAPVTAATYSSSTPMPMTAATHSSSTPMPIAPTATHLVPSKEKPYILVAEDNEVNQFVVMQILEGMNIAHEIAANGRLAVEAWVSRKPSLILMDVSMPEMSGLVATQKIRELEQVSGRHTPIIGLTAHALKGDEERCLEAGMDAYMTKPVSPEKLEALINKWSDKGSLKAA